MLRGKKQNNLYLLDFQVKVDAKTKTLLDEYRKKKKAKEQSNSVKSEPAKEGEKEKDKETADVKENGEKGDKAEKEEGEESSVENEDELDEDSKREDRVAQAGLEAIMREYAFELAKEPPSAKPSKLSFFYYCRF